MARHNIILSEVLNSQKFVLGVRLGEEDESGSTTFRDFSELLFDEIEV